MVKYSSFRSGLSCLISCTSCSFLISQIFMWSKGKRGMVSLKGNIWIRSEEKRGKRSFSKMKLWRKSFLWACQFLGVTSYSQHVLWYHLVATWPQTVKSLCLSVIPGSVCWHTRYSRIYNRGKSHVKNNVNTITSMQNSGSNKVVDSHQHQRQSWV